MTVCVVCQRAGRHPERGLVCEPCRVPLPGLLDDIAELHDQLDATPVSGSHGPRVTGSREAPLPLRVDALDLAMPARGGTVHDLHGDQIGLLSVGTLLDQWVEDWRGTRDKGEGRPIPAAVSVLAGWLTDRLDWAADEHPAVDEFVAEMRDLRRTLRAVSGLVDARPERLVAPCPSCDLLALVREPDAVRCSACPRVLSEDDYREWVGLLAQDARMAA